MEVTFFLESLMAWRLSEEEAFENFQKQMTEGNAKLFWDNFALFMRNWKKIRKYPALFNVKVGQIGFSPIAHIVPSRRIMFLQIIEHTMKTTRF